MGRWRASEESEDSRLLWTVLGDNDALRLVYSRAASVKSLAQQLVGNAESLLATLAPDRSVEMTRTRRDTLSHTITSMTLHGGAQDDGDADVAGVLLAPSVEANFSCAWSNAAGMLAATRDIQREVVTAGTRVTSMAQEVLALVHNAAQSWKQWQAADKKFQNLQLQSQTLADDITDVGGDETHRKQLEILMNQLVYCDDERRRWRNNMDKMSASAQERLDTQLRPQLMKLVALTAPVPLVQEPTRRVFGQSVGEAAALPSWELNEALPAVEASVVAESRSVIANVIVENEEAVQKHQREENVVPPFLAVMLGMLRAPAACCEGVFRLSAKMSDRRHLAELLQRDEFAEAVEKFREQPHVVAGCLKDWMRSLPDALVPREFYRRALQVGGMASSCSRNLDDCDVDDFGAMSREPCCVAFDELAGEICGKMNAVHRACFDAVVAHLRYMLRPEVKEATRMGLDNLARVFSPTLVYSTPMPGDEAVVSPAWEVAAQGASASTRGRSATVAVSTASAADSMALMQAMRSLPGFVKLIILRWPLAPASPKPLTPAERQSVHYKPKALPKAPPAPMQRRKPAPPPPRAKPVAQVAFDDSDSDSDKVVGRLVPPPPPPPVARVTGNLNEM